MSEHENRKTASERLEELENTVGNIIQALSPLQSMASDLNGLKEALKLLNNKLDSLVKVINANGGNITDEALNKAMVQNNVNDLTDKVKNMVSSGLLSPSDTVSKDSFVVINEADPSGTVVNPRMQFLVSALQHEEIRGKLEGSKVGDNILVGDQGSSINVLESYSLVLPAAEVSPEVASVSSVSADGSDSMSDQSATSSDANVSAVDMSASSQEAPAN